MSGKQQFYTEFSYIIILCTQSQISCCWFVIYHPFHFVVVFFFFLFFSANTFKYEFSLEKFTRKLTTFTEADVECVTCRIVSHKPTNWLMLVGKTMSNTKYNNNISLKSVQICWCRFYLCISRFKAGFRLIRTFLLLCASYFWIFFTLSNQK